MFQIKKRRKFATLFYLEEIFNAIGISRNNYLTLHAQQPVPSY